jgi:WD40 repeat protein
MTDVFISYSRIDIAFARLIREALQQSEIEPWIDWERIPVGEKWWNEICSAIQGSNTFLFIISKNSLGSTVCKDEIKLALENHKRIIPIVVDDLSPEAVRAFIPELPQINWVVFERDHIFQLAENGEVSSDRAEDRLVALPKLPQFTVALEKLTKAIHTDWDWVKAHTNLQVDALRWSENQHNDSYLLRGEELAYAENLLLHSVGKDPQPTSLQVEFITASRGEETLQQQKNLRIQQEKLLAEQKATHRQRMVIWAIGIGLIIAAVLGVVAWGQRNQYLAETHVRATAQSQAVDEADSRATAEVVAVHQQRAAEVASTQAVQQRDEAQHQAKLALASKLAAQSQLLAKEQVDLSLLLSVAASRTTDTLEAQLSPRLALETSPRLHRFIKNTSDWQRSFAISPDGQTLAVLECSQLNTIQIPSLCIQSKVTLQNINTGQMVGTSFILDDFWAPHMAFNQLDNGKTLIFVSYSSIIVWDIQAGKIVGEYPTGQKPLGYSFFSAAFSPDGRLLAMASCGDRSEGTDANGYCNLGEMRIWDIEARQFFGEPVAAGDSHIYTLAFSPDSRMLASGGGDDTIKLWSIPAAGETQAVMQVGEPVLSGNIVTEALAFSPDGKLLASGGSEHVIRLWDLSSMRTPVAHLMGHSYRVSTLAFSPDGKTLASGSWDDTLLLWDVTSHQALEEPLTGHQDDILHVSYLSDGKALLSIDRKGNLIVWDTSSQFAGSPLGRMITHEPWSFVWTHAFSPDGNILAYSIGSKIYLWDIEKHQLMGNPLTEHKDEIRSLVFPPQEDGRILVSASKDHAAITWDVTTGEMVSQTGQDDSTPVINAAFSQDRSRLIYRTIKSLFVVDLPKANHRKKLGIRSVNGVISDFAVTPDGELVAATLCEQLDADQDCTAWSIQFWKTSQDVSAGPAVTGLENAPSAITLSPNGRLLAYSTSKENTIYLLDWQAGKVVEKIHTPAIRPGKIAVATNLVFSPDGKQIAASYLFDAMVILWNTQTGRMVGEPFMEQMNIGTVAFSPDSRFLAWQLGDIPFIWEITSRQVVGQPIQKGDASGLACFSADGKQIVLSGGISKPGERGGRIFDATSGRPITELLVGHVDVVQALAFSADGQQLLTFSRDNTLNLWDLATRRVIAQPLAGYLGTYAKVNLSPDGRWLASAACKVKSGSTCLESELWLQELTTGTMRLQRLILKGSVSHVRYSPNGRILAVVFGNKVILWDIASQTQYSVFEEPAGGIDSVVFSPDGRLIAIKSDAIHLWDLESGEAVGEPIMDKTKNSNGSFLNNTYDSGVAFSPDGLWIATVGNVSGSLLLVNVATGQPFGPLLLDPRNQLQTGTTVSVAFSPDGKKLVSGNNSGKVFLWDNDPISWQNLACFEAGRNLTHEEWAVYMPASEPYRLLCHP